MTRQRMYKQIRAKLSEEGLEITDECKAVTDAAICVALDYVLTFTVEISEELISAGLYSEAMVAGLLVRKIKDLQ